MMRIKTDIIGWMWLLEMFATVLGFIVMQVAAGLGNYALANMLLNMLPFMLIAWFALLFAVVVSS